MSTVTTTTTTTTTEDPGPLMQEILEVLNELADIKNELANIKQLVLLLIQGAIDMDQEIENLRAQVESVSTVEDSAIQLLNQLGDMMRAAADDPAQVRALADQVQAKGGELATAVAANTPAPPA